MIFLALSEKFFAYLLLGLTIIPIALLMIYAIIVALRKSKRLNQKYQTEIDQSQDQSQINLFFDIYGGSENIISVSKEMSRISVVVHDIEKVKVNDLPDLGANGVLLVNNIVKCSFGDRSNYIYDILRKGEK